MNQAKFKIVRQGECEDWELWVLNEKNEWELYGSYIYYSEATRAMERLASNAKVEEFFYDSNGRRVCRELK